MTPPTNQHHNHNPEQQPTPAAAAIPTSPQARVGTAVFVLRQPKTKTSSTTDNNPDNDIEFLIGKRLGSHGADTWGLPGGHLEFNESLEECAVREVFEETGLKLLEPSDGNSGKGSGKVVEFLTATNDVMKDVGKHYVTCFMVGRINDGQEARICEADKCEEWRWISWGRFVRWARWEMGGEEGVEEYDGKLFSALISIVEQRPGVVPRW